MKNKVRKFASAALALIVCAVFAAVLMGYAIPMEDKSLDLSLGLADGASLEEFDEKGWTVFTQEADTVTELESNGVGGYTGIELGQTLYFSRVLEDDLDSPTLQLGTVNRNFSVFLDGELIYTDCPEQDNRIGYLKLPMREWETLDPLTISLPADYRGKTLTIAQSTPEYSERPTVVAYPTDVTLYCGYAYESGLIAESYQTAFAAILVFAVGVVLALSFLRSEDTGMLCIGLAAFAWMMYLLVGASYFYRYYGESWNRFTGLIRPFAAGTLLFFLYTRAGTGKKKLVILPALYSLLFAAAVAVNILKLTTGPFISLTEWAALGGMLAMVALGVALWRKENRFYRLFAPLSVTVSAVYWVWLLLTDPEAVPQLALSLSSGQVTYVYSRQLSVFMFTSLIAAIVDAVRSELDHRVEKQLQEKHRELALASYKNMRQQHEEVMLLRHDMSRHFQALRAISTEEQVTAYLDDLIGQTQKIRPVVKSGNEMLDIILGSKISAAADAGVKVEIVKAEAPEKLPLRDADLCSLVMNIMDNAVTAAAAAAQPFIRLSIHTKGSYFAFVCENSADHPPAGETGKKETVPKHGLGLKIIRSIADRYDSLIDTEWGEDYYKVTVAIPLDESAM